MKKIRIAFIKYVGLSAGGTEKFLQTIAAHLDKNRFEVDYYYTESVPYIGSDHRQSGTDANRMQYMKKHGVNLIEAKLKAIDLRTRTHDWIDTDFFEIFDETKYDIVQTGRAGHPEYPFSKIRKTPIVDSLHLIAGVDNQYNISRVMHITKWSRNIWEFKGGDSARSVIVSHPIEIQTQEYKSLKPELGLEGKFVFGFHQRNDPAIFSPIQLEAYKSIEKDMEDSGEKIGILEGGKTKRATHFIILGGSDLYKEQAKQLGIKNITFLDHSADPVKIYSFLKTLDVYAHGRKDGEVNSTAMAEAMYFGLPIISHVSDINNGHVECIGNAGYVAKSAADYADELRKILSDEDYLNTLSKNALTRFEEIYEMNGQMKHIESIYSDVIASPFPHPIRRYVSSFRLRRFFVYFPYKIAQLAFKKLHDTFIKKA